MVQELGEVLELAFCWLMSNMGLAVTPLALIQSHDRHVIS